MYGSAAVVFKFYTDLSSIICVLACKVDVSHCVLTISFGFLLISGDGQVFGKWFHMMTDPSSQYILIIHLQALFTLVLKFNVSLLPSACVAISQGS